MAFRAPKGTYDIVPPSSERWHAVRAALMAPAGMAGYSYVETPVFEDTGLFERGVGESTDVVSKEMYTFADKGGRSITLRPEGTAGVVRAIAEHGLERGQLPVKLWYAGPMFRYERPQAGRFRQFQQVGLEAVGVDDPSLDAEVVALGVRAFEGLGLRRVTLLLNSMGDAACRPAYVEALRDYLRDAGPELDEDTRVRAELNPLRVLDDKRPAMADLVQAAPVITNHLCADCRAHYSAVRDSLQALGIVWTEAPRLVRGLDYYMRTTFEWQHDGLGAQSAVGGGGRYDGLSESIGGPALPGIGWALGMERTLLALEAEALSVPQPSLCEVFVVPIGAAAKALAVRLVDEIRRQQVAADLAYGDRGLKGAMKAADRSGARFAIVVGERDLGDGVVQLKHLTSGEQHAVEIDKIAMVVVEAAQGRRP
ncbi:MAG: histidine--tRNA ligase [Actinomycetota bacterium]|nr:histidine--tRNA ligase [Actinomycetota bacterium]